MGAEAVIKRHAGFVEWRARFEAKVEILESGCHVWIASTVPKGYGKLSIDGKLQLAHRASWFLHTGEWPTLCVLHTCDNPPCVRFDHLFLGTILDNNQDMARKGRCNRGDVARAANPSAKLTEEQVEQIRALRGQIRCIDVATQFGISKSQVSAIQTGRCWANGR
jgi:hypothetical protein